MSQICSLLEKTVDDGSNVGNTLGKGLPTLRFDIAVGYCSRFKLLHPQLYVGQLIFFCTFCLTTFRVRVLRHHYKLHLCFRTSFRVYFLTGGFDLKYVTKCVINSYRPTSTKYISFETKWLFL